MRSWAALPSSLRRGLRIAAHLLLMAVVNEVAFRLRFGGAMSGAQTRQMLLALPLLLIVRLVAFERYHLFDSVFRYTDSRDLRDLIAATFASSAIFFILVQAVPATRGYDFGVVLIDAALILSVLFCFRLGMRLGHERSDGQTAQKRVLIYGAGDAGALIAREMKSKPQYGSSPVGFLDDDRSKHGSYIDGIKVLGGRRSLADILIKTRAEEVLLAMPSVSADALRAVVASLEPFDIPLKTLPKPSALLGVSIQDIRSVTVEDLLARPPVMLDLKPLVESFRGRRILVTGAGGSIGSELCRQLVGVAPALIIAMDRNENSLFSTINDVARGMGPKFLPLIGDVTDETRVDQIFRTYQPDVIFHAAAHKHVPLMESNPCEAVKNNVRGTRLIAEASIRYRASRFVLISTDKAVKPASVMGATKRVAEQLVQAITAKCDIVAATVRFGNVLGSSGSVVPLFRQQIRDGGPVTVTDPEVQRFFMLIPEAVQLVLHAATIAEGGEILVLRMGPQVRVLDMARNMIRLAGARPGIDVRIEFTGLRPGEKLTEELFDEGEVVEPSSVPMIMRVRASEVLDPGRIVGLARELEDAALAADDLGVLDLLRRLVPTYKSFDAGTKHVRELSSLASTKQIDD
jgi:FlaA1/EpsC-like NDP-sugar epimerase